MNMVEIECIVRQFVVCRGKAEIRYVQYEISKMD
jgi:hypothetical protein